jgi:CheY-like chemotaxis protein
MRQVVMNLVVNAREAMSGGGTVTIETRNVVDPARVVLQVRDTGQGIDESIRRHLFEPFFTTKKGSKNTGMGLATVFGIVSHAGGKIDVDSQKGEGSVFRIYLPRSPQAAERPESAPNRQPKPLEHHSGPVLVVEDRPEVRTLTCRMLKRLGYQTLEAGNGADALSIFREQDGRIPLLLTDVVMPGMNGRELAEQLRQVYPHVKTVFMSGYTDRILDNNGVADALAAYLQKPFSLAQLAEVLQAVGET